MIRAYLAGGWFTASQEEEHTRLYNLLKDKADIFNPRIAGEINTSTSHNQMSDILIGNIEAIQSSDIIVMIYDGKDTGTIWEAGFAYANEKPIVYYAEKLNGKPFNLMLAKTGFFVSNEKDLIDMIEFLTKVKDTFGFIPFKNVYDDYEGEIE